MNPTAASQQQFCVRWNSHLGSLGAAFPQLLAGQRFVDVTLACEGHQLHCHRLVLAACSSYFESLLSENPCKHPIVIMPQDIKLWEIQALVDFMYKGEVNVSQAGLTDLLKCAELLQIRGLCGADAALNLNSIANNGTVTAGDGFASLSAGSLATAASGGATAAAVVGAAIATLNSVGTTAALAPPSVGGSSLSSSSIADLTLAVPTLLSTISPANNLSNSALKPPGGGGHRSNSAINSCPSPSTHTIGASSSLTYPGIAGVSSLSSSSSAAAAAAATATQTASSSASASASSALNHTKRMIVSLAAFEAGTASNVAKLHQQYATSTPNTSAILTPKLEPVDVSIVEDMDDDSITTVGEVTTKSERDDIEYSEGSIKQPNEFALANVICEYDGGLQISMDTVPGRRVRRSEAILRQAAECVSKGQTFQTVSDMFNIPISTIRFFMARKGILPRRKRGRAAGVSIIGGGHSDFHNSSTDHSRSASPSEPPFHFANYKLPEIKPKLV